MFMITVEDFTLEHRFKQAHGQGIVCLVNYLISVNTQVKIHEQCSAISEFWPPFVCSVGPGKHQSVYCLPLNYLIQDLPIDLLDHWGFRMFIVDRVCNS